MSQLINIQDGAGESVSTSHHGNVQYRRATQEKKPFTTHFRGERGEDWHCLHSWTKRRLTAPKLQTVLPVEVVADALWEIEEAVCALQNADASVYGRLHSER